MFQKMNNFGLLLEGRVLHRGAWIEALLVTFLVVQMQFFTSELK